MKILLLLLFLTLTIQLKAQKFKIDLDTKSEGINLPYCMIDSIVNTVSTKNQVFSNTMAYIANSKNYNNSRVELKDLELGEILFSGHTVKQVHVKNTDKKGKVISEIHIVTLFFKCRVYCKDENLKSYYLL